MWRFPTIFRRKVINYFCALALLSLLIPSVVIGTPLDEVKTEFQHSMPSKLREEVALAQPLGSVYHDPVFGFTLRYPSGWAIEKGKFIDPFDQVWQLRFIKTYNPYMGVFVTLQSNHTNLNITEFVLTEGRGQSNCTYCPGIDTIQSTVVDTNIGIATKIIGYPLENSVSINYSLDHLVLRFESVAADDGQPLFPVGDEKQKQLESDLIAIINSTALPMEIPYKFGEMYDVQASHSPSISYNFEPPLNNMKANSYDWQNPHLTFNGENRSPCYGVKASDLWHAGEDGFGSDHTTVHAIGDGTVTHRMTWSPGVAIVIQHNLASGEQIYSMYGHLENLEVTEGQNVVKGQKIGDLLYQESNTHLHWELRKWATTSYKCPSNDKNVLFGPGYTYPDRPYDRDYFWPTKYVKEFITGITIYEHPNFQGHSLNLTSNDLDLCDNPLDPSQPLVVPCFTAPSWTNNASSIKVAPGWHARLHKHNEADAVKWGDDAEQGVYCGTDIPDFRTRTFPDGTPLDENVSRIYVWRCDGSTSITGADASSINDPCKPNLPGPTTTDKAQFTNVESPADNTIVSPSQAIHKTWRVKNTGNRIWGPDHKLVFIGGNQMGAPNVVNIPVTEPGGVADISIDITAPAERGEHVGYWQLRNPQGTFFGDKLWVRLTTQRASNYLTLTADPPSPSAAGRITVQAKARNFPNLRAMRLRIDGVVVHELGAAEFYYDWNTAAYAPGIHNITLEVADQTDTEWQHPEVHSLVYMVTGTMNNLNRAPYKPALTSPHDWTVYYTGNTAQLCAQANGDPDGDSVTAYFFESIGNWSSGWVSGNCVTTATLAPRTYQWHVKVRDSKGAESAWSDDWHFTLVNPVLSITQLAFEPQDGNSEAVKIRACTAGQGGVGITLRVSINAANDGRGNGIWRTIHELGVPCYNDIDAPIWYTLDYADGPHRVRVEAHGSSTGWDGAAVREEVYTLPHRRPAWTQLVSPVPLSQNQHEAIYLNTRSITFRWQPTLRAENYTLHISTQPNPQQDGAPVFRQTLPAGTTAHTLEFDQAYPILYWQVNTTNSQGSNTAGAQHFGVDQTLPSCNLQALPTVTYDNIFQVAWSTADDLAGVKSADVQYLDERDAVWRDWQIATSSAQSFALFIGQPGHTYRFRCRARDHAGNQGVYTNPSAAIQIDPSVRPVEPWWNTSYTQRRSMTVLNNMTTAALPIGYPLLVRLDNTTTPSAATLFNASATSGKCNDVRVVYNNTSELPRYIPVCTTDRIEIWLSNQASLAPAAANNTAYRLYYGNADAGEPPADQAQIWPPLRDGNTAGLWFFSEGTGSTLADHSGYGNPGHLRGLTWVDGIFGKALASTTHASGNGALIPGSAALGAAAFTLEFFAKRDDLEGGYIAGQGRSGDDNERMRLRVEGPGSLSFQIDPPAPGGASDIRAQSGCLPDLQWHHIAVTFDGVREGRIYCDGVLAGSGLFNATGISNRNFDLYLGSDFSDAGRFKGAIDQVRFSTIVRTTFPQAQFAAITAPPSLAVGDVVPSAAIGAPDLVVLGLNTYPHAEGGVIVEALVQNQGNRETQNGFYTDLYIDHLPTGVGDYTGSAQFWVNSPIAAGATVTLTTVLTDFNGSGVNAAQSQAPAAETTHLLYMQTDSAGVVPDANKANNIFATGVEVCFANPDAFEGDDVVTQATTLPLNQAQSHNFSDAGDQDWVKFNAEAGKEYTFSTHNLGPAADTYLYLYNTDGATLLTANDDGNDSLASQIHWTAPAAATYYLLVRHWNPNVAGCGSGYELLVESGQTAPIPTFTPTPTPDIQPPVTATPTPTATVVEPPVSTNHMIYLPNIQQNSGSGSPVVSGTPTPMSPSSTIAFVSDRDGNYEIYRMNISNPQAATRLTHNPSLDYGPDWSPDGSKIAFDSDRDSKFYEIYVMNADGTGQTRLTNNTVRDAGAAWSPDGSTIAFASDRDGNFYEIYVMNANGSNPTRLTNNTIQDAGPVWSPDGTKIAYASWLSNDNVEIYVMNADGTSQARLTNVPGFDDAPRWSPDGTKIAFSSWRDGLSEIYVMNVDGSNQKRLTNHPARDFVSDWSPDGQKIIFRSDRDGNWELYTMNPDGSGTARLTNTPSFEDSATWKP